MKYFKCSVCGSVEELTNREHYIPKVCCKECYVKQKSVWVKDYYDKLFEKYNINRPSYNKRLFKQKLNIIKILKNRIKLGK